MENVTLGWAAKACGGRLRNTDAGRALTGLSIDSRTVRAGELFAALPGTHTDGHAYIPAALAAGAAAVLCRRAPAGMPALVVPDPRRALGRIAAAYRRRFPRLLVAAVTGSSGKTATKEMLARALGVRYRVLESEGNLNNDLGLPLTLARLGRTHTAAVVELGMNAPGEIRRLAALAGPALGIITNVGEAHLGRFTSRAALGRAKAELLAGLKPGSIAVLNADDAYLRRLRPRRRLTFGINPDADVRVERAGVHMRGTHVVLRRGRQRVELTLRSLGVHQAWNAAAAVAAAVAAGVPFAAAGRALDGFRPRTHMRGQLLRAGAHYVLHDAYNSNPQSAAAALALLAELPCTGRRWFVAGSMLELGPASAEAHRRLGREAAVVGVAGVFTVGREARPLAQAASAFGVERVRCFDGTAGVAAALVRCLSPRGDLILVKGSRAVGLERVVADLQKRLGTAR